MKEYYVIKIINKNLNHVITKLLSHNIVMNNIEYHKDYLILTTPKSSLNIIKRYYKVIIIRNNTKSNLISSIKQNILKIISLIINIIIFLIIINSIVKVNINTSNDSLKKEITKELDNYNIHPYILKKNYNYLEYVKQNILKTLQEKLEWIEIKNVGMTYEINIEERKKVIPQSKKDYCNVIASSNGIITKIIANNGVVLVKENTYVKEGDTLISGDIYLNEEQKNTTCASGTIYAEKWYDVSLSIPKTYQEKRITKKVRYNILFEHGNKDYKIFKSRLKNYDTSKKEIISLFNNKLYLLKEKEYVFQEKEYTNEELDKQIDNLITEKINLSINESERILYKNTLHKSENNSKIDIDVFVTAEKIISKQV